jgi:hypothetical protein
VSALLRFVGASVTGLMLLASTTCAQPVPTPRTDASSSIAGQLPTSRGDSSSAHQFVQAFYDWYAPIANAKQPGPSFWRILASRPEALDSGLLKSLRADSAFGERGAKGSSREAINFDPFLYSQDPCARYEVVETRADGVDYRMTVVPICADTTWQTQRPIITVRYQDRLWQIVNVLYENSDLRSLLCDFAKRDTRPDRRSYGCEP